MRSNLKFSDQILFRNYFGLCFLAQMCIYLAQWVIRTFYRTRCLHVGQCACGYIIFFARVIFRYFNISKQSKLYWKWHQWYVWRNYDTEEIKTQKKLCRSEESTGKFCKNPRMEVHMGNIQFLVLKGQCVRPFWVILEPVNFA